jgi:hypothetical protein
MIVFSYVEIYIYYHYDLWILDALALETVMAWCKLISIVLSDRFSFYFFFFIFMPIQRK